MTDENAAEMFIKALETIATKPANIENFKLYLSRHFSVWMEKYANTPEKITAEIKAFSEMEI